MIYIAPQFNCVVLRCFTIKMRKCICIYIYMIYIYIYTLISKRNATLTYSFTILLLHNIF